MPPPNPHAFAAATSWAMVACVLQRTVAKANAKGKGKDKGKGEGKGGAKAKAEAKAKAGAASDARASLVQSKALAMRGSGPPVHSAAPRSSPGAEAKTDDDTNADARHGRRGLEVEANAKNHDRRQGRRALATQLTATQHSGLNRGTDAAGDAPGRLGNPYVMVGRYEPLNGK